MLLLLDLICTRLISWHKCRSFFCIFYNYYINIYDTKEIFGTKKCILGVGFVE